MIRVASKRKKGFATGNCHFRIRPNGALLMNFFDIPIVTPFRQKFALDLCAKRGFIIGGNPYAKEESFKFAYQFIKKHLSIDLIP